MRTLFRVLGQLLLVISFATAQGGCSNDNFVPPGGAGDLSQAAPWGTDGAHPPADLGCHAKDMYPERVACGNCGTMMVTCGGDGRPIPGACEHQGICAAGTVIYSPDGCSMQVCGSNCQWTPWNLKPGAQCPSGGVQTCKGNCSSSGTQVCGSNCQWGPCTCH